MRGRTTTASLAQSYSMNHGSLVPGGVGTMCISCRGTGKFAPRSKINAMKCTKCGGSGYQIVRKKKRRERVHQPTTTSSSNVTTDDTDYTDTGLGGPTEPVSFDVNLNFPGGATSSIDDTNDAVDDMADGKATSSFAGSRGSGGSRS